MLGAPFAGVGGVDAITLIACSVAMLMSRARSLAVGMPEMIWRNRAVFFAGLAVGEVQVLDRTHLTQHRLVLIGEPFEPSPNTHPRRRVRDKRGSHPNHRADVTPRSFTRTAATGNTPSRNQPVPGLPINALNTRPPRQIHTTEHTHYNVRTLTITQYSANCSEPLLQE